jgi:hypothetical protein
MGTLLKQILRLFFHKFRRSKKQSDLVLENLALRQQLSIYHPPAEWTAQQLVEACPWDTAPKYLLRDRDRVYGSVFQNCVKNMGIIEVKTAPKSPWQNPYVERFIGSIRRDCLDHMIVLNEKHLKRVLADYFGYYHHERTHLGLKKETPFGRPLQKRPKNGQLIKFPRVGGLHHRYEWRKAA